VKQLILLQAKKKINQCSNEQQRKLQLGFFFVVQNTSKINPQTPLNRVKFYCSNGLSVQAPTLGLLVICSQIYFSIVNFCILTPKWKKEKVPLTLNVFSFL
jgi:hypothetical protein